MARGQPVKGAVAEPLSGPARERRDWTARARGTALDAFKYSQFVGLMKRALPIAAAAIVAAVLVYSFLPRPSDRITVTAERTGWLKNDLAMVKPKLTGADNDGNPFVVTAEVAVQEPKNLHRAHMKKIEADITMNDGHWINATADTGFFDMDVGTLNLVSNIAVFSDSGYEVHTSRLDIDMKKGLYHGPDAVTGHGPSGAFRADRFAMERRQQLLHLIGNVHTTFYAVGKKGK
jgi:lipopolysaccharide export system protein LptC